MVNPVDILLFICQDDFTHVVFIKGIMKKIGDQSITLLRVVKNVETIPRGYYKKSTKSNIVPFKYKQKGRV